MAQAPRQKNGFPQADVILGFYELKKDIFKYNFLKLVYQSIYWNIVIFESIVKYS